MRIISCVVCPWEEGAPGGDDEKFLRMFWPREWVLVITSLDSRIPFLVGRAAACQRVFLEGYEALTKD